MLPRINDAEATMFAVAAMSVGLPVGKNFFKMFPKTIRRKRYRLLEEIQSNFTEEEAKLIAAKVTEQS